MMPSNHAVGRVLQLAATGTMPAVLDLASSIVANIDHAVREKDERMAARWRNVSRVVDGIAELRFDGWAKVSPARARDKIDALTAWEADVKAKPATRVA